MREDRETASKSSGVGGEGGGRASAPFSNQNVKGPIFPEGREKSLKGGQLLAAQFNQKIKHRGAALTLHRGQLEIVTSAFSFDPSLFLQDGSANSNEGAGQIAFPRNSL